MKRDLYKRMSKWKLKDEMIKQFIDHLFKPRELRYAMGCVLKRLKEIEPDVRAN